MSSIRSTRDSHVTSGIKTTAEEFHRPVKCSFSCSGGGEFQLKNCPAPNCQAANSAVLPVVWTEVVVPL